MKPVPLIAKVAAWIPLIGWWIDPLLLMNGYDTFLSNPDNPIRFNASLVYHVITTATLLLWMVLATHH